MLYSIMSIITVLSTGGLTENAMVVSPPFLIV